MIGPFDISAHSQVHGSRVRIHSAYLSDLHDGWVFVVRDLDGQVIRPSLVMEADLDQFEIDKVSQGQ